jgi:hypothetical protein
MRGDVTNISFAIAFGVLVIGLLFYVFVPYIYVAIVAKLLLWILKLSIKLFEWSDKRFDSDNYLMVKIKVQIKVTKYLMIFIYGWFVRFYLFIFDTMVELNVNKITPEMRKAQEMAIRSVAAGRQYSYITEEERTSKTEDGQEKVMPLDEALKVATEKNWTVFHVRARGSRQQAEERDRMTEMRAHGKSMVYELRTGTMDFQLLLGCLIGWERLLSPEGPCERCNGIVHEGECLDFEALISSKVNQDKNKAGMYKNEIALDHIPESIRTELAGFVRKMDSGNLGEESEPPIGG